MEGLAELHTHLGGSVSSDILWSLAHEQGIALPVKDYWEFDRLVTIADPRGVADLNALAAIRGLDLASLEYPQVNAGLILMMDRTFTQEMNAVIVDKAIRWAPRGICGIDVAGPRPHGERYAYRDLQPLVEEAREAGLGITIHVGEEGGDAGIGEIAEVIETLRPDRIGHGILAARDLELMETLRATEIVLEICPTSNLLTKALESEEAVRETFRAFTDNGVLFTIATDGPEMMRTHLRDEFELLVRIGALEREQLPIANERGHAASFVRREHVLPAA